MSSRGGVKSRMRRTGAYSHPGADDSGRGGAGGATVAVALSIVSNSDGFRSRRDFREPDARRRIVVLGDSMVFGSGVEESERFTEVLESMEPGWRVDNLGMVAYGPDLMLRALETVGVALKPDVVLFAIFSHDFYRVMPEAFGIGFPLPRYVLEAGRLVTVPYPERPAWMRTGLVQAARYSPTSVATRTESSWRVTRSLR